MLLDLASSCEVKTLSAMSGLLSPSLDRGEVGGLAVQLGVVREAVEHVGLVVDVA